MITLADHAAWNMSIEHSQQTKCGKSKLRVVSGMKLACLIPSVSRLHGAHSLLALHVWADKAW